LPGTVDAASLAAPTNDLHRVKSHRPNHPPNIGQHNIQFLRTQLAMAAHATRRTWTATASIHRQSSAKSRRQITSVQLLTVKIFLFIVNEKVSPCNAL
jgi:hypothetical protein